MKWARRRTPFLRDEMRYRPRCSRQPATVHHTSARRHGVEHWRLATTLLSIQRALKRHGTRQRTVRLGDAMHAAIVLAPDANVRRVHVESAESHVMNASLHLRSGVRGALFELAVVHGLAASPTTLGELVRKLEHRLQTARERRQVRPIL
jgi:hypothetical protein